MTLIEIYQNIVLDREGVSGNPTATDEIDTLKVAARRR